MENLDVEFLINLVRHKEYLYNKGNRSFKDVVKKENAWKEIAETLNSTSELCEKEWKGLKERYTRERKKTLKSCSGSGAVDSKTWVWYDDMSFIDEFIQQRRRYVLSTSSASVIDENNSPLSSYYEESQVSTDDAYRQAESEVFDLCKVELPNLCGPSTSSSEDTAREISQVQQVCTPPSKRQKTGHLQKKLEPVNIDKEIVMTLNNLNKSASGNVQRESEEKDFGNLVAFELSQMQDKVKRKEIKRKIMELIYSS